MADSVGYTMGRVLEMMSMELSSIAAINGHTAGDMNCYTHYDVGAIVDALNSWQNGLATITDVRMAVGKLTSINHEGVNNGILPIVADHFTEYARKFLAIGSFAEEPIPFSSLALPLRFYVGDTTFYATDGDVATGDKFSKLEDIYEFIYNAYGCVRAIRQAFSILVLAALIGQVRTKDSYYFMKTEDLIYGLETVIGCGTYQIDIMASHLKGYVGRMSTINFTLKNIFGVYVKVMTDTNFIKCNGVFRADSLTHRSLLQRIFNPMSSSQTRSQEHNNEYYSLDLQSVVIHLKTLDVISGVNLSAVKKWGAYLVAGHSSEISRNDWLKLVDVVFNLRDRGYNNISITQVITELENRDYSTIFTFTKIPDIELPWWTLCLSVVYVLSLHSIYIPLSVQSFDGDLYRWAESNKCYING